MNFYGRRYLSERASLAAYSHVVRAVEAMYVERATALRPELYSVIRALRPGCGDWLVVVCGPHPRERWFSPDDGGEPVELDVAARDQLRRAHELRAQMGARPSGAGRSETSQSRGSA